MMLCYGSPDAETDGHEEASVQTVTVRALAEGKAVQNFCLKVMTTYFFITFSCLLFSIHMRPDR